MSTIYVFGHKNPDNDAIMSAVMLSQLLNATNDGNIYEPRRLGKMPSESAALLESLGIPEPALLEKIDPTADGDKPQKVILTDHNEKIQTVDGIENADIVGIIDHHRIGNFTCPNPIMFITLPWGSSCSIVYYLFGLYGVTPSEAQLKCLLSAMMTDMVLMKSPTTTDIDRKFIQEIADKLAIDPIEFGLSVFMNRSSDQFTADQMVNNDIKGFEVAGKRLYIGQYETVDKTRALGMLKEIREAMEQYQSEHEGDAVLLCVTDIMKEGSHMLMCGETELIERGLGIENKPEGIWMQGVLSRKKQVAAPIMAANEV